MSSQPETPGDLGATTTPVRPIRTRVGYPSYQRRTPWAWWMGHPRYQFYMVRELSAIFAFLWSIVQIRQLQSLNRGESAYRQFVREQRRPGMVLLNLIGYAFAWLHAFTWWKLLGGLDLVKIEDRKMPPEQVERGAFGLWALVSAIAVLVLFFGGRRGR